MLHADNRVPALDGIRGIAILMVFAVHTTPTLLAGGRIGVDLFFVLSGFLITTILLREERSTGSISLWNFYMRRILRLYPAVAIMTVTVMIYAALLQPEQIAMTAYNAIGVMTYWFNWQLVSLFPDNLAHHQWMFSHVWSLSVEEQFYIVWPAILILTTGKMGLRLGLVAAGIIGPEIGRLLIWPHDQSLSMYFRTDLRFDGLMWGALAALLLNSGIIPVGRSKVVMSWAALAGLIALFALASFEVMTGGFLYRQGFVFVGVASTALIYGSMTATPPLIMPLLTSRLLRWVGKISYGLYLWHWPVIRAVGELHLGDVTSMLVEIAAAFAIASASFYLVEVHFLRIKQRFETKVPTSGFDLSSWRSRTP